MSKTIRIALLFSLLLALPLFAERHRAVSFPNAPIPYSGTVIDSVTAQPVIGAEVVNGTAKTTTDSFGKFTIGIYAGVETTLTISRSGYETTQVQVIAQPGTPGVTVQLKAKPTVTVTLTTNDVYHLDAETVQFVYAQPLGTQLKNPTGEFCENGSPLSADRTTLAHIYGPAVSAAGGACCQFNVGWFDIEMKAAGDRHHVSLLWDCRGYLSFLGGNDHTTNQTRYISFSDIKQVDFP